MLKTLHPMTADRRSAARRTPVSCVWIETRNPRQPLACVWIDDRMRQFRGAEAAPQENDEPPHPSLWEAAPALCA